MPSFGQTGPLPSWNNGSVKKAMIDFVARISTAGSRDFLPVPERIATFDNDGPSFNPANVMESVLNGMKEDKRLKDGLDLDRIRGGLNQLIEQQLRELGRR